MHASGSDALDWRVSRTCESGACVKVARHGESVLIGSTTGTEGIICEFTIAEWREFLAGMKLGDFDGIA